MKLSVDRYSNFLNGIDFPKIFAFALSGTAGQRKLNAFGMLIVSFVTAIGSGTVRAVLPKGVSPNLAAKELNKEPFVFQGNYALACLTSGTAYYFCWNPAGTRIFVRSFAFF